MWQTLALCAASWYIGTFVAITAAGWWLVPHGRSLFSRLFVYAVVALITPYLLACLLRKGSLSRWLLPLPYVVAVAYSGARVLTPQEPPWRKLDPARAARVTAAAVMYLNHPELTAADVHHNWVAAQRATGWTYGVTFDPIARLDPLLLSFANLDTAQQTVMNLFRTLILAQVSATTAEGP